MPEQTFLTDDTRRSGAAVRFGVSLGVAGCVAGVVVPLVFKPFVDFRMALETRGSGGFSLRNLFASSEIPAKHSMINNQCCLGPALDLMCAGMKCRDR